MMALSLSVLVPGKIEKHQKSPKMAIWRNGPFAHQSVPTALLKGLVKTVDSAMYVY